MALSGRVESHARAFEHFAPLVHGDQPRVGEDEAHQKPPGRFGVKWTQKTYLKRARGASNGSLLFLEEEAVERNRTRAEGCQCERTHAQDQGKPVTLQSERMLKDFFVPPQSHCHLAGQK